MLHTLGKPPDYSQLRRGNTREFYWLWAALLIGEGWRRGACGGVTSPAAGPSLTACNIPGKEAARGAPIAALARCSASVVAVTQAFQHKGAALDLGCKQGRQASRKRPQRASVCAPRQLSQSFLGDTGRGRLGTLTSHFLILALRSDAGLAGT